MRDTHSSAFAGAVKMADAPEGEKKSRSFRKFQYRGVDLDQLLDLAPAELVQLFHARARRRCVHT
jgi:small subunit ribosomal protein S15e